MFNKILWSLGMAAIPAMFSLLVFSCFFCFFQSSLVFFCCLQTRLFHLQRLNSFSGNCSPECYQGFETCCNSVGIWRPCTSHQTRINTLTSDPKITTPCKYFTSACDFLLSHNFEVCTQTTRINIFVQLVFMSGYSIIQFHWEPDSMN